MSGKADVLHLGFGVLASIVITITALPPLFRSEVLPWRNFFSFIPWHLYQVVVSNLRVARVILQRHPRIKPSFVITSPNVKGDQALTLLGFAVTLTPGTLTVDIDDQSMLIHALDEASAQDVKDKVMAKRVNGVFRRGQL